jgi:hypothetical protein
MHRLFLCFTLMIATGANGYSQAPQITGRWTGEWISETSGHSGPLKARIRQIDDCTYRATFRGRFALVIPFWYTTKFHVDSHEDTAIVMSTTQQLPLIGEYRTTATVTPSVFDARYSSRRDSGRFFMTPR